MGLLAAAGGWTLDIIFFVALLIGTIIGAWRGIIKSVCKIAGTIFAGIIAISYCTPFANTTGLTAAMAAKVAQPWAGILSVIISMIALFVIVKLSAWLIGKIGTALLERSDGMRRLNRFLGGTLGLLEAFTAIVLVLTVLKWIGIDDFMNTSYIVKYIYNWDWFGWAMSLPFAK